MDDVLLVNWINNQVLYCNPLAVSRKYFRTECPHSSSDCTPDCRITLRREPFSQFSITRKILSFSREYIAS